MSNVVPMPIIGSYDKQRFIQFSPEDCANWTATQAPSGKKKFAFYPVLGRRHFNYLEQNKLIFNAEARALERSINYWYVIVSDNIYRIDNQYNQVDITGGDFETISGDVDFTFIVSGLVTYVVFVDGQKIYVYQEPYIDENGDPQGDHFYVVTDSNAPEQPTYVATFGDRIVVSSKNSSQFSLSVILLGGSAFDPDSCFTINEEAVFAQEAGIIKQFAVLNNTLYIFTDFNTGLWSNIPSNLTPAFGESSVIFPWKKSSSYNWDFGIADPNSLDVDFQMMVWLAQNQNGLVQVMVSDGGQPARLSTKAIDVLFQKNEDTGQVSPFLSGNANGELYQYENVIYYRLSAGEYNGEQILDQTTSNNSIEFNFDTKLWGRCIEVNGERCRVQKHVFFNSHHFVSVQDDNTVYEFSGHFYNNEVRNPDQPDPQAINAYLVEPFRYERITPIISEDDYSEFITDYVQIDFVFGLDAYISWNTSTDTTYDYTFKPHVELYYSDDGGISFSPADVREFSQLGTYKWRMRWYQLGPSRDRCYKLICVSTSPMVILGGVMQTRRASGGAN